MRKRRRGCRGSSRRPTRSLACFAILTLQGFQNVYIGITVPNPESSGFHEAMGFELIGTYRRVGFKLGRWLDTRWYGRPLGDYPIDPAAPRTLTEVRETPGFQEAMRAGEAFWRGPRA